MNSLENILENKKELFKLFLIAAMLAFSVGSLSSLFVDQTTIPRSAVLAISIILIILPLYILCRDLVSSLNIHNEIEALFLINPKNELKTIRGYYFSEQLSMTIAAVKAENKAIYSDWERDPLVLPPGKRQPFIPGERKLPKASHLLEEAVLFLLLQKLSIHLTDYFSKITESKGGSSSVKEYSREDIPASILSNRIINLITTPPDQREIFLNSRPSSNLPPNAQLISASSGGALYERFSLTLPKGSKLSYTKDGNITIETKRLSLRLSAQYFGSSGFVSRAFCSRYVGADLYDALDDDLDDVIPLNISIRFSGRVKVQSLLFSSSGWVYYRWLDSFRESLRSTFDFATFQKEIQWELIEHLLHCLPRTNENIPGGEGSQETGTR